MDDRPAVTHSADAEDVAAAYAARPWIIPEAENVNLTPTLGEVIGAFQSLVFTVYLDWTKRYDPPRRAKFWQRNYYEHIIRSERALQAIRQYIRDNPDRWELDRYNPHAAGPDPRAEELWQLIQAEAVAPLLERSPAP